MEKIKSPFKLNKKAGKTIIHKVPKGKNNAWIPKGARYLQVVAGKKRAFGPGGQHLPTPAEIEEIKALAEANGDREIELLQTIDSKDAEIEQLKARLANSKKAGDDDNKGLTSDDGDKEPVVGKGALEETKVLGKGEEPGKAEDQGKVEAPDESSKTACPFCPKEYASQEWLDKHIKAKHADKYDEWSAAQK
jgi:hypothetical protein